MKDKDLRVEIAHEFYRCFDKNQSEKLCEIISDTFLDHDAQDKQNGLEESQNLILALHEGFSHISHELEQIHLIGKDKIFVRWKMTGKHTGTFFHIPSSEKDIVLRGHDLFRIVEGKIVELWHIEQLLSLVSQLSPNEE